MKTLKFLILIAWACFVAAYLASCAPKAYPVGPSPLDTPGELDPTAAELHAKNIRWITRGNF